jgi:phosphatidylglycerol---prolipoprotein diacylglyceryl transferase
VIFAAFVVLRRDPRFAGRLIFLYFAVYGVFRFFHEFMRDTPPLVAGVTGYQILSLVTAAIGVGMFVRRGRLAPGPAPHDLTAAGSDAQSLP